jgi:hypothetical protein
MTTTFKNQSAHRPTAMGTLLQSSAYGSTIPVGYGLTQSNLLAIWAANLRQGGGNTKKFKQVKKGITNYEENIDFLLGHNPVRGVIQVMNNGSNTPVAYASTTFSSAGGRQSFSVTDPHFYFVLGVTLSASYSFPVDDYGGQGAQTLTGTFEIPLWNELETGPDPTDPSSYRCWPFCYRWQSGMGTTIEVDAESFPTGTVTVYYAQLIAATSYQPPITKLFMAFEPQLGSGDEYSDAGFSSQQIQYPQFAGLESSGINLGASGALPQLNPEVAWKWGIYPSGDADFVDMIEDIVKSGFAQAAIAAATSDPPTPPTSQMERGLSSYQFPGTIQKKNDSSAAVSLPPMKYDMANTKGNFLVAIVTAGGAMTIASNEPSWTPLYPSSSGYQIWYTYAVGGPNTVTVSGASGSWEMSILEIGGTGGSLASNSVLVHATVNASSGSIGSDVNTYSAVSSNTSCALNITGYYPPLRLFEAADAQAEWSAFEWPLLPAGAVVTGIIPVCDYTGSNSSAGTNPVDASYTSSNWPSPGPPPMPGTGHYEGSSIGTTEAVLTAWNPKVNISVTLRETTYNSSFAISNLALRVEYTIPPSPLSGDLLDAIDLSSSGPAALSSSVAEGLPAYLLAVSLYPGGSAPPAADQALWNAVTPENLFGNSPATFQVQDRVVYSPGDYSAAGVGGSPASIALIALKAVQPVNYPRPLGDFIDLPSANLTRLQCRAGGLWGSLTMNSQSSAADWLKMLCQAANCAPVFLGSKLYLIPYSEVSAAGNGALYTAPTAAGPVANLNADNGDFLGADGAGCPRLVTSDRVGQPNVLQMQFIDRNANYTQTTAQATDPASIGLYCVRKAQPITMNCVQDPTVARTLLGIEVRRNQYGGDVWSFQTTARWSLLSPMDLITLTDYLQDVAGVPVRITKFNEQDNGSFQGEAEPFVYGMSSPTALTTTGSDPNSSDTGASAGNVNAPVIFEPVPRLFGNASQAQLWLAVSSAAANYGGCQVYISTDGGSSYQLAGDPLMGSATTGSSTADWPANTDPDTTHNLALDLSESNGTLGNYSAAQRDAFGFPCFIAGGGSYGIPYELLSYNLASLTGPSLYTLMATGSGNELRRGVFGAPSAGVGVDHPSSSRFAFLNPSGQGILKLAMDPAWIGVTLYFKILSFNNFGSGLQSLSDVSPYTFTPTGVAGNIGPAGGFLVNGA